MTVKKNCRNCEHLLPFADDDEWSECEWRIEHKPRMTSLILYDQAELSRDTCEGWSPRKEPENEPGSNSQDEQGGTSPPR